MNDEIAEAASLVQGQPYGIALPNHHFSEMPNYENELQLPVAEPPLHTSQRHMSNITMSEPAYGQPHMQEADSAHRRKQLQLEQEKLTFKREAQNLLTSYDYSKQKIIRQSWSEKSSEFLETALSNSIQEASQQIDSLLAGDDSQAQDNFVASMLRAPCRSELAKLSVSQTTAI